MKIKLLVGQVILVHDMGLPERDVHEYKTATEWLLGRVRDEHTANVILDWHGKKPTEPAGLFGLAWGTDTHRFTIYPLDPGQEAALYMTAVHNARPDSRSPLAYRRACYKLTGVPEPEDLPQ